MQLDYKNCVYRLYFEGDNRSYIGSSRSAKNRLRTHIWDLLRKKHPNQLLQTAFNKYGYLGFRWEILEKDIKTRILLQKEHEYIIKYKADTEGFNQTMTTSSRNNAMMFLPNEIVYDNIKYIKWWLENKNIEFKEIRFSSYRNIVDKNSYSKGWWTKLSNEEMRVLETKIYHYARHIGKCRMIKTMMICGGEEKIEKEDSTKTYRDVRSLVRKFKKQPYTNQSMSDIIITTALNPLHTEMLYMSEDELNQYRVAKLFRLLQDCNLDESITIHLPHKYYEGMMRVVSSL